MTIASLTNVAVAVTGGAHGIGRAVAEHFARAGARVAIGDLDGDAAEVAAQEIGEDTIGVRLDVTDLAEFESFLAKAQHSHGPLGVMVNNAGIDWMGPFHAQPHAVSHRELEVNLMGTIIGSRLALQRMIPRCHGHLVNIASGAGRVPLPGSAVYCATKHGIVGLTESLRLEYRGRGIGFTLVHPAQVKTAMMNGQPQPHLLPQVTADDVATAVLAAVRQNRFEVWVPSNQWIGPKFGTLLPRRVREGVMRAMGVGRIAGEANLAARTEYHDQMFRGS